MIDPITIILVILGVLGFWKLLELLPSIMTGLKQFRKGMKDAQKQTGDKIK